MPIADSATVVRAARPSAAPGQLLAVDCDHLGAQEKLTKENFADDYVRAISRFLAGQSARTRS